MMFLICYHYFLSFSENIEQGQSEHEGKIVKPLNKWSVGEVCKWLDEIGLEQYQSAFEQNAIDQLMIELDGRSNATILADVAVD